MSRLRAMSASLLLGGAMLGSAPAAHAADWVTLQATEPDDPDKATLRPQGFVQVSAEGYLGEPVDGEALPAFADHDGQHPIFNTVGGRAPWSILLRRIRGGVRGDVPGTQGLASVNLSVEFGQNPLTTVDGRWLPKLMDASMTVKLPADLHVRLGRFKTPLADESLEAFFLTTDLVRFSKVTGQLLMERDAHGGTFTGTIDGFRDLGAQIGGSHLLGDHEVSWALMGATATVELAELRWEPNVTGRIQLSRLLDGPATRRSPFRDAAEGWVFASWGTRRVGEETPDRLRVGIGGQLRLDGLRLRSELMYGDGVLVAGMAPPFPGNPRPVDVDGRGWGITGLATYRIADTWQLGLSYSHLDRAFDGDQARRVFNDGSLIAEAFITPKLWFALNAGLQFADAPNGPAPADALLGLAAPYLAFQATAAM